MDKETIILVLFALAVCTGIGWLVSQGWFWSTVGGVVGGILSSELFGWIFKGILILAGVFFLFWGYNYITKQGGRR